MGIDLIQGFLRMTQPSHTLGLLIWQLSEAWRLVAQEYNDHLFGNVQATFDNFVQSGQVWALLVGFVLGYFFKGLTAY